jgi:hypothetical protein
MTKPQAKLGSIVAVALALAFSPGAAWTQSGTVRTHLANGIEATIYPSEYLLSRTTFDGTRGRIDVGDGTHLTVITEVADPEIVNKGDGAFHAFATEQVIEALGDIDYDRMQLGLDVLVLPFPRINALASSTTGRRIFLSPHVSEIADETAAYIVAHETGHVFQSHYLSEQSHDRWTAYRRLRRIDDVATFHAAAAHADRPVEIFAEDFRVFFGGPLAYFDGRIENPSLPAPATVPGLHDFFMHLAPAAATLPLVVSIGNYPNPFNPRTSLVVELSPEFLGSGERVSVRVFDVSGALVRELYSGSPGEPQLRVDWDGRDQAGCDVGSSVYFGVVTVGSERVAQKMMMIK